MTQLKFITREHSAAQGKPRVLFCSHQEDRELYLTATARDILAVVNCAVFYYEEIPSREDLLADLEQMQLLVIPVTRKLLTQSNTVMETVVPYGLQHHIPILPLVQEPGLEQLFNEKFENLHFLVCNDQDTTALAYKDKLQKHLQKILVDDDLAQQIRQSFDGYIFLSYRKKDRLQARELMQLIHQNDAYRDMAIWYDEFLTPGEDFGDSIEQAIEKSKLFVLAVTPNVIEKGNYVMQCEYPKAQKIRKAIVPAILQPTDGRALQQCYPGLPEGIDPRDPQMLSLALAKHLHTEAMAKNRTDPRHLYLMGLAYLSGIDVEVDHTKALQLLQQAAKAGWVNATMKLVDMYCTGIGVAIDFTQAIWWTEFLISQARLSYKNDPCESTAGLLAVAWLEYDNLLEQAGKIDLAQATMEQFVAEMPKLREEIGPSRPFARALADGHHRLGKHFRNKGLLEQAQKQFTASLELLQEHLENAPSDMDIWLVTQNQYMLASFEILGAEGSAAGSIAENLERSEELCEKLVQLRQQQFEQSGDVEAQNQLAIAYERLGDALQMQGYSHMAEEQYLKAHFHYEILEEESPGLHTGRAMAMILKKLGNAARGYSEFSKHAGGLELAQKRYEAAIERYEALCRETDISVLRGYLAECYSEYADVQQRAGAEPSVVKVLYEKADFLYLALAQEGKMQPYDHQYFKVCRALGQLYQQEENTYLAAVYKEQLALKKILAERKPTLKHKRQLALAHLEAGHGAQFLESRTIRIEHYQAAIIILEQIAAETKLPEDYSQLATAYENLGTANQSDENLEVALALYDKAFDLRQQIADQTDLCDYWYALAKSYFHIGLVISFKHPQMGLDFLQKAMPVLEKLQKQQYEPEDVEEKLHRTRRMIAFTERRIASGE